MGYSYAAPKVASPKSEQQLIRALEINSDLSEAYASYGDVKLFFRWDWAGSEEAFKKAISINPNYPEARRWYSHFLLVSGRYQEAHEQIDIGIKLKSASPIMYFGKAVIFLREKKFELAKELSMKMISVDPNYVMGLHTLALSEFGLGNFEESLKLANKGLHKFPNYSQYMVAKMMALNRLERLAEAELIRGALFKRQETDLVPAMTLARAEYYVGNMDEAVLKLEQAYEDRNIQLFPFDPRQLFDKLNGNQRFDAIWEKVGLPEFLE